MFYTYILQSESSGKLYIGQTQNVEERLVRHQAGYNTATKGRGPWVLIFNCGFETRAQAYQLEQKLKAWKSKKAVLEWIKNQHS